MISRKLAGLDVSAFALGAANFGGVGSARRLVGRGETEAQAHALLDAAVSLGVDLIDTAGTYGDGASESFIGSWLASRGPSARHKVRLSSKVGIRGGLSPAHVRQEVDRTLARLRTDFVDFYLAHVPDPATPWPAVCETFRGLVECGKVRAFGLSNVSAADIRSAAAGGAPTFGWVQNRFNLLERDDEGNGVVALCRALGLGYTPYSPLAGGLLGGRYAMEGEIPHDSRLGQRRDLYARAWTPSNAAKLARLKGLAEEVSVSPAGLAVWWLLQCDFVTSIVLGARQPEQLERMVTEALGLPPDGALRQRLDDLGVAREGPCEPS
ncbi:MAG: aldo/keto reductase [Polyangiaceae bacterium]|nr:aldo/keto reductase [Polyangiaceae bacterium]